MKILCVCERGNSRSVCLAWILKDHMGQDAIAVGITAMSPETRDMMMDWADKIILVVGDLQHLIPEKYKEKTRVWDVGVDVFFRGFEPVLINTYLEYINKYGI